VAHDGEKRVEPEEPPVILGPFEICHQRYVNSYVTNVICNSYYYVIVILCYHCRLLDEELRVIK